MRIAVAGSGISGLAAAWLLAPHHDVHLFEARDRLGGHTHTLTVGERGGRREARTAARQVVGSATTRRGRTQPPTAGDDAGRLSVDTGFIVYNEPTYPLLTALLDELDVATQPSDMSWSLRCDHHDLEYAGNPRGVVAQPRNLLDPHYLRFLADIARFNRLANRIVDDPRRTGITIRRFLAAAGFGRDFGRHYLVPMAAAIWSTGTAGILDFPLQTLLDFFRNHGLLGVSTHHPWRTVTGGSASYITPMLERLDPDHVHLGAGVRRLVRDTDGVSLTDATGETHRFDSVVVATHADQALAMLADPTDDERELLGAWAYSTNDAWLHTDGALLPDTAAARASWNYLLADCREDQQRVSLTYDMNRLQSLPGPTDWLVTLNPASPPASGSVLWRGVYDHPSYTMRSVATQARLSELDGHRRTWFAGAYHRYAFHEDGLWSAVRVAADLGVQWPPT